LFKKWRIFSFGKIPSFSSSKRSTFQESKFGHSQDARVDVKIVDPFKLKHETTSESEMLGGVYKVFFFGNQNQETDDTSGVERNMFFLMIGDEST